MNTDPNPQGKGLVQVLKDVASSRAKIHIPPKKIDQIAGELFTSMLVLKKSLRLNRLSAGASWRGISPGPSRWRIAGKLKRSSEHN